MKEFSIGGNEAGQRLDKYLAKRLSQAPKSFVYKMLRKKNITLNKKKAGGSEILAVGDLVQLFFSDETYEKFSGAEPVKASHTKLSVLYEDDDVILINKPAGMLSMPDHTGKPSLTEYLTGYLLEEGALTKEDLQTFHPGVCNRLDRNTSGIVTAGKSLAGLQDLSALFKERNLHKYYLCLCHGVMEDAAHLKGYLRKDERTNQVQIFSDKREGTTYIETKYRPLGNNGSLTLLEVELLTGKTHQIRGHLAFTGHPILGDIKYRGDKREKGKDDYRAGHQMLHAWRLVFPVLSGALSGLSQKEVRAPLPREFEEILKIAKLEEYDGRL